jgi:hypothetical protein
MNVVTLEADLWWIVRPDDIRPVRGLTIHMVARKLQEKFNFVSLPSTIPAEGQPFSFKEGMINIDGRIIPVKLLEAFNDGVHIKVESSTEDADIAFKEMRSIVVALGGKEIDTPLIKYHVSTIVADFENDIGKLLSKANDIFDLVSAHLEFPVPVGLKGLQFGADPSGSTIFRSQNPSMFRLDTRLDTLLSEKRYFSRANMTTENHIKLLAAFDELVQQ